MKEKKSTKIIKSFSKYNKSLKVKPYNVTIESLVEARISKFNDFNMNKNNSEEDVISFLYSLKDADINGYVNDFLTTKKGEKEEYIEDILLEIGDKVENDKYNWVSKELKNY